MHKLIFILALSMLVMNGYGQSSVADLYNAHKNSVVVIYVSSTKPVGGGLKQKTTEVGLGSGVIIDNDGTILTAAHVVQTAEKVIVEYADGSRSTAKVISLVSTADVAMIKALKVPKMATAAKLANSDDVRVGEQVMVIGTPFGINQSLSVGYISGRRKMDDVYGNFAELEFFQTDAAINTGNSGGPMFNMNGEIIGIVSYIFSPSGGFDGLGFAASSNMIKTVLIESNPFWSGLEGEWVSDDLAHAFNIPQSGGILVEIVVDFSPMWMMGLRGGTFNATVEGKEFILGGDIILGIDDIQLSNILNLGKARQKLTSKKSGEAFSLTVLRHGEKIQLSGKIP